MSHVAATIVDAAWPSLQNSQMDGLKEAMVTITMAVLYTAPSWYHVFLSKVDIILNVCIVEVFFNKSSYFTVKGLNVDILPAAKYVCSNHASSITGSGWVGEPDVCYVKWTWVHTPSVNVWVPFSTRMTKSSVFICMLRVNIWFPAAAAP